MAKKLNTTVESFSTNLSLKCKKQMAQLIAEGYRDARDVIEMAVASLYGNGREVGSGKNEKVLQVRRRKTT